MSPSDHADTVHAFTHKPRPTLLRHEVSERAMELVEELDKIFKLEEKWYVAEHYLDLERLYGHIEAKEDGADQYTGTMANVGGEGHGDCPTVQGTEKDSGGTCESEGGFDPVGRGV